MAANERPVDLSARRNRDENELDLRLKRAYEAAKKASTGRRIARQDLVIPGRNRV